MIPPVMMTNLVSSAWDNDAPLSPGDREILPLLTGIGLVGMSLIAGGVWLSIRAVRNGQFSARTLSGAILFTSGTFLVLPVLLFVGVMLAHAEHMRAPPEFWTGAPVVAAIGLALMLLGSFLFPRGLRV